MSRSSLPTPKLARFDGASRAPIAVPTLPFPGFDLLTGILNTLPNIFLVLDSQRRVAFANKALLTLLGLPDDRAVRGRRSGDLLGCVHADETEGGCGTTDYCQVCGALSTILASLRGTSAVSECRIRQKDGGALDLRVSASPLVLGGECFSLVVVEDIGDAKRRAVLEQVFFHDILNLAGVLTGYASLLRDLPEGSPQLGHFKDKLYQASMRLVDEIQMQRDLIAAENGELALRPSCVQSLAFLGSVQDCYRVHDAAKDRDIQIDPQSDDVLFDSDPVLLERVLGNLVKNALEAIPPGEIVTLRCRATAEQVIFEVHNPTVMLREVQLQVFQRSFSTKGKGRGLGTYGVKLLSERYLGGSVTFTTSPEYGTTFRVVYPLVMTWG
jgi:hypothetical protein